jgi:hypothetical protein
MVTWMTMEMEPHLIRENTKFDVCFTPYTKMDSTGMKGTDVKEKS